MELKETPFIAQSIHCHYTLQNSRIFYFGHTNARSLNERSGESVNTGGLCVSRASIHAFNAFGGSRLCERASAKKKTTVLQSIIIIFRHSILEWEYAPNRVLLHSSDRAL